MIHFQLCSDRPKSSTSPAEGNSCSFCWRHLILWMVSYHSLRFNPLVFTRGIITNEMLTFLYYRYKCSRVAYQYIKGQTFIIKFNRNINLERTTESQLSSTYIKGFQGPFVSRLHHFFRNNDDKHENYN